MCSDWAISITWQMVTWYSLAVDESDVCKGYLPTCLGPIVSCDSAVCKHGVGKNSLCHHAIFVQNVRHMSNGVRDVVRCTYRSLSYKFDLTVEWKIFNGQTAKAQCYKTWKSEFVNMGNMYAMLVLSQIISDIRLNKWECEVRWACIYDSDKLTNLWKKCLRATCMYNVNKKWLTKYKFDDIEWSGTLILETDIRYFGSHPLTHEFACNDNVCKYSAIPVWPNTSIMNCGVL